MVGGVPGMSVSVAPAHGAPADSAIQQLLMRFIGALNRRRAYAATHPMVQAAEEQFHEAATALLSTKPVITIGVARTDLLIDGEPYHTRSSFARELATRLHRRGVGAVTMQAGLPLLQLRETLAWLATEAAGDVAGSDDAPPVLSGISVTMVAYDQLSLGDTERAAEDTGAQLWRTLAHLAGEAHDGTGSHSGTEGDGHGAHGSATTQDREAIVQQLRRAVDNPDVARRTAIAFMDLAAQASVAPVEGRVRIGEQLNTALNRLGETSFGPVIRALGERSMQQRFVSQVVDVLPVAAIASWLQVAAKAQGQQMSHHMLRLMTKLSTFAEVAQSPASESVFRGAAQDLVRAWALDDPNPDEHVALLDRIAMHERAQAGKPGLPGSSRIADIESSRLVQMALEIDVIGEDACAAADALVAHGSGEQLLSWIDAATPSETARTLKAIATNERAIRTLLLTEPVDRLQARALLERLDIDSADTLIDVLEAAEARGTRMIVRQRLSEFGAEIAPKLLARLDNAPWYLVRNILTLLHEITAHHGGSSAGLESMARLLDHPQVQVRTEAFRVLVLEQKSRDSAIRHALHDENERIVMLALQTLSEPADGSHEISPQFVTVLKEMVDGGKHSDTVRARMVRTLAPVHDEQTRDWLIGLVARRSRILRRMTLVEPTQTAVAAVQVLQRSWASDATAQDVIALARKEGIDRRWQPRDVPATSTEQAS